ncbi:SpdD-like protein [Streptomyces sp. NPDC059828]|uniref:SpdD-like protein n=1 Tax=Streptomyces sp. NPDC059828 TaxID=3346965 RepID=UPI003656DB0E
MFQPRIPVNPLPTGTTIPLTPTSVTPGAIEPHLDTAPCACQHHTSAPASVAPSAGPSVRLSPAQFAAVVGGGAAVVLVVGAVLVSLLLALAVTGVSVAICAVVLRSLLNDSRRQMR